MFSVPLFLLTLTVSASSALPTGTVKYDQRQDGELNVRADLQNFVVLIVPTPSASLMNLFRIPGLKGLARRHRPEKSEDQETQNFIESKTAPYHVDLTKSKEKLHPDVEKNEEMLAGRSPIAKSEETSRRELQRFARAYVITVPNEIEQTEIINNGNLNGKTSKIKEKLLLLGAMLDQCGPDSKRDETGVCRLIKRK